MAAPSAAEAFAAGSSARAAGDLEASVLHYDAALRLNPALAEAHINRAAVLADLGNRGDEAVHAYVAGLSAKRWPRSTASAAYNNLGVLLRDLQRRDEAARAFERALAAKPDFELAATNLHTTTRRGEPLNGDFVALIHEANDRFSRGQNAEAAHLYRAALPLRDARVDASAYVGLGAALHSSARLAEARHVLAAGARLSPATPGMMQNLATVRSDLKQWKGAVGAWRRALALVP